MTAMDRSAVFIVPMTCRLSGTVMDASPSTAYGVETASPRYSSP